MSSIQETKDKIAELEAKLQDLYAQSFKDELPKLWEKLDSKVEAFSWTQYTPYFNDGDECVFHCQFDYPSFKLVGEEEEVSEYGDWDAYSELEPERVLVEEFLNVFSEEYMKRSFGDHARVIVNRDGTIDTDSYDHD